MTASKIVHQRIGLALGTVSGMAAGLPPTRTSDGAVLVSLDPRRASERHTSRRS
ncbi:hypothetical protein [Streptomyces zaomyceticus]|uniref:hypothetical protein n=1 Tax=Streptomyces zaomyceticus TaxID=68286 RepID=UPI00342E0F97